MFLNVKTLKANVIIVSVPYVSFRWLVDISNFFFLLDMYPIFILYKYLIMCDFRKGKRKGVKNKNNN